jgi:hypothetical protein
MNDRYDEIAEAHKQTFRWIYERPELKFVDWLKAGKGIYWISGKAGCGKSTLMKFLFEDRRTYESLPKDIDNTSIFSFFFHDREEIPLLKSQEGLFRAIIHSILSKYRQLIPTTLPRRWEAMKEDILSGRNCSSMLGWSMTELRAGFNAIVSQRHLRLHLSLSIGGLDELAGRHQDIVDTLADLLPTSDDSYVRVQLCLSSRPLVVFEKSYLRHLHLKVQDLTAADIKIYVTINFNKIPELRDLLIKDPTRTNQIIEEILLKAEGVSVTPYNQAGRQSWLTLSPSIIAYQNSVESILTSQYSGLPLGHVSRQITGREFRKWR